MLVSNIAFGVNVVIAMNIYKADFSLLNNRVNCPYCDKIIFSLGEYEVQNSCEHLMYVYDDYEDVFLIGDADHIVVSSYQKEKKMMGEDEELLFEDYISSYNFDEASIKAVTFYIYDEKSEAIGGLFFGFIQT